MLQVVVVGVWSVQGRFISRESEGVDAFSVLWRMGRGFFHPPVGLVARVIRKAERES